MAQKRAAEQIVTQVPGVQGLNSQLTVADAPATAEGTDDRLARRVEFELYSTKAVSLKTVQIRSQADGTVVLSGSVPSRAEKPPRREGRPRRGGSEAGRQQPHHAGAGRQTRADDASPHSRRDVLLAAAARAAPAARWRGWRRHPGPAAGLAAPRLQSVRDHGPRGDGRTRDTSPSRPRSTRRPPPAAPSTFPPGDLRSGTVSAAQPHHGSARAGAILVASRDDADFDPVEELGYESFADAETSASASRSLQGQGLERLRILGPGRLTATAGRDGPKPIALKGCRKVEHPRRDHRQRGQLRHQPAQAATRGRDRRASPS